VCSELYEYPSSIFTHLNDLRPTMIYVPLTRLGNDVYWNAEEMEHSFVKSASLACAHIDKPKILQHLCFEAV
jgi:hypothetical protein